MIVSEVQWSASLPFMFDDVGSNPTEVYTVALNGWSRYLTKKASTTSKCPRHIRFSNINKRTNGENSLDVGEGSSAMGHSNRPIVLWMTSRFKKRSPTICHGGLIDEGPSTFSCKTRTSQLKQSGMEEESSATRLGDFLNVHGDKFSYTSCLNIWWVLGCLFRKSSLSS